MIAQYISNQRPKRETMSPEEATVSNVWKIMATVKVIERKGILPKGKK